MNPPGTDEPGDGSGPARFDPAWFDPAWADTAALAARYRRRMESEERRRAGRLAEVALAGPWRRGALADRLAEQGRLPVDEAETLATRLIELSPSPPFGPAELAALLRSLPPRPATPVRRARHGAAVVGDDRPHGRAERTPLTGAVGGTAAPTRTDGSADGAPRPAGAPGDPGDATLAPPEHGEPSAGASADAASGRGEGGGVDAAGSVGGAGRGVPGGLVSDGDAGEAPGRAGSGRAEAVGAGAVGAGAVGAGAAGTDAAGSAGAPGRPAPVAAEPGDGASAWRWDVPRWATPGECARALDLTPGELEWFADAGTWNRRAGEPLRHYRQTWVPTRSGGVRLLEQPKPRLAELQRRVARHVLARIPLHDAAHGFRPGRSVETCAAPHAGQAVVVRMDLEGFFASVTVRRVRALLGRAGYPPRVARLLAGLLTTATPADVLAAVPTTPPGPPPGDPPSPSPATPPDRPGDRSGRAPIDPSDRPPPADPAGPPAAGPPDPSPTGLSAPTPAGPSDPLSTGQAGPSPADPANPADPAPSNPPDWPGSDRSGRAVTGPSARPSPTGRAGPSAAGPPDPSPVDQAGSAGAGRADPACTDPSGLARTDSSGLAHAGLPDPACTGRAPARHADSSPVDHLSGRSSAVPVDSPGTGFSGLVPAGSADPSRWRLLRRLAAPHLPQGAPTSPAVANAVAYRLDVRLAGLARALGARYTRYADDLAFSGDAGLPVRRLVAGVARIVRGEGFRVRASKTSVARAHQRQKVAGLVVNAAPAVPRAEYDALRALLHNCARTGPAAQNRDGHPEFRAHLLGRIGWVGATHPARAARLRALFDQIPW
ncbi:Reverse transcriptase (RNA-dependent DNA polymerase) [Amycolatopsis arida]|uniref:RNA-directed DNA polymerase n=1 Tax=Amycolatopsis arida TaxID=587909 RepID=A0A1I5WVP4_9PSEU|nr:reverse transcriptase (RNA-dependent DNA polymerase) [Amycolatopsis arida]SFQ23823.1 Reverse transcriptase (RNA-dependent DNA polymerase) [Amycolatopsis arida]